MRNKLLFNIFLLLVCSISFKSYSQQVSIGEKEKFLSTSSILEFPDNDTRGIVLPKIHPKDRVSSYQGTLYYDILDKKVIYAGRERPAWGDLSIQVGSFNDTSQDSLQEVPGARTYIGNNPNKSIDGVLVLDSTDKALVLPRVESPHLNIINPPAGTIVYDIKANLLCVYNGKEWTFWGVKR